MSFEGASREGGTFFVFTSGVCKELWYKKQWVNIVQIEMERQ